MNQRGHSTALILLILTTSLIIHTTALPLPTIANTNQQIILQSTSSTTPSSSPIVPSTTTSSNFIATQTHLSLLPELLSDAEPLSDPFSTIPLTSLRSPGKGRPGRPGRPYHADIHGGRTVGFGRTTIWNPWTWRSDVKRGEGCRWHSYRREEKAMEIVGETLEEEAKVEVTEEIVSEKVEEGGKFEVMPNKDEHSAQTTTTPRMSLLDALIGEELFISPATSSTAALATKALGSLDAEPSHTQLDQSAFPSGLKGRLVAFERVPMVEFVTAAE